MKNENSLVGLFTEDSDARGVLIGLPDGFVAVASRVDFDGTEAVPVIEIKAQLEEMGQLFSVSGVLRLDDARALHSLLGREIKAIARAAEGLEKSREATSETGQKV